MYQILLVDDEEYALEGLMHGVPFRELGFEKVHIAKNAVTARQILLTEPVDIVLCDIEMPGESGLDLVEWMQEFKIPTLPIILTCHADFEYSRKALQLGSFDYILKPVAYEEVTEILKRAITKVERRQQEKKARIGEKLFIKNRYRLVEELWKEILQGELKISGKLLEELCLYKGLKFVNNGQYRLVMLDLLFKHKDVNAPEDKNVQFAICNLGEEILIRGRGWLLLQNSEILIGILQCTDEFTETEEKLKGELIEFITVCRQYLECYFNAFYSSVISGEEIQSMYEKLRNKARRQVLKKDLIIRVDEEIPVNETRLPAPDTEHWSTVIKTGAEQEIVAAICDYTREKATEDNLNNGLLEYYTASVMQIAYSCAAEWKNGMDFLHETKMQMEMNKAFRSLEKFELFVRLLARELCVRRREHYQTQKKKLSDRAKEYVNEHLGERLLNDQIAQAMFLNVDYLNRVFKKETGMTLSEYISRKRVDLAKELLLGSDMTVSEIAMEVGFQSFSYFTKVFKKRTGKEPLKYRKDGGAS